MLDFVGATIVCGDQEQHITAQKIASQLQLQVCFYCVRLSSLAQIDTP